MHGGHYEEFLLAWSRNRLDPGTCTGKMEYGLSAHGGGRPRGQESQTHQYGDAYEVGPQIDASSIKHGHPGVDGQLRESIGLGPAIRAPAGPISILQGPGTGFFSGQRMFQAKLGDRAHFRFLE